MFRWWRRPNPEGPRGPLYEPVREAMTAVRAYANSHGGDIELLGVDEEGNVEVRLRGACRGCPMADVTLRLGVERQLREQVPGVRKVRAI